MARHKKKNEKDGQLCVANDTVNNTPFAYTTIILLSLICIPF